MSLWRDRSPLVEPKEAIMDELRMIALNENDRYMDGFVTSKYKKELLDIYWYIEDLLDKCSNYGDTEKEWFEEREKQKFLKKLSNE
jgi:hypothetical protein